MLLLRILAPTSGFNLIVASNRRKQRVSPVLSPDNSRVLGPVGLLSLLSE